jgi:type I restriction enzyme, S subunit
LKTGSLADFATLDYGFAFDSKKFNTDGNGLPLVRIRNVVPGKSATFYSGEYSDRYLVEDGDFLIGMDGQFNLARWRGGTALLNQRVCRIGALDESVDRNYLAHFLPRTLREIEDATPFVTVKHLSAKALNAVLVPLPPLDEQRRIATILDHAEVLRTKRRQVLAHLDTLTQSIFHDMFGDPEDAERQIAFGDVTALVGGRNLVHEDAAAESLFRVLKISAVTSGQFLLTESKPLPGDYTPPPLHMVRPGDLLMSRANTTALVGAVAYVNETPTNLALPDKVWKFAWHDNRSVPLFYHALFSSATMRRRISQLASGTGGSMKNISKAKLDKLSLPMVDYARQEAFATHARAVIAAQGEATRAVLAHSGLFAALQSRAFSGQL